MTALRWPVEGYGYEVTDTDVLGAFSNIMNAAEKSECGDDTLTRMREIVAAEHTAASFVSRILSPRLKSV